MFSAGAVSDGAMRRFQASATSEIFLDEAVTQANGSVADLGSLGAVGDHDYGTAILLVDPAQQVENNLAVF